MTCIQETANPRVGPNTNWGRNTYTGRSSHYCYYNSIKGACVNNYLGQLSLPVSVESVGNIETFRRKLKTHLLKRAYPP